MNNLSVKELTIQQLKEITEIGIEYQFPFDAVLDLYKQNLIIESNKPKDISINKTPLKPNYKF